MAKSKYIHRVQKAFEYAGIPLPCNVYTVIRKKAKTDGEIDALFHSACKVLEPPGCKMSHCESFTTYAFCNCSKGLIPGKCPKQREYLKRKRQREEAIRQGIIDELVTDYKRTPEQAVDDYDHILRIKVYGNVSNIKAWWAKNKPKKP